VKSNQFRSLVGINVNRWTPRVCKINVSGNRVSGLFTVNNKKFYNKNYKFLKLSTRNKVKNEPNKQNQDSNPDVGLEKKIKINNILISFYLNNL
jgi:hypothetical protein